MQIQPQFLQIRPEEVVPLEAAQQVDLADEL
jgi:hypothetical protein